MSTISSLGIGSGLDLATLLTNLTTAENARLTPISTQQTAYSAKLTAYGTLTSAVQTFANSSTALTASLFKSSTATSSATSSFTATTDSTAATGTYNIAVTQLAQAQSLVSGVQTDSTTAIGATTGGTRTLTISQGTGTTPLTISLTDAQTSLGGIRDAINAAAGGVTASVIQASDSSYQLVLSSNKTGTDNDMTVSVTGDDTLQSKIGYNSTSSTNGMTESVAAKNAELTVNNIAIERDSNTITNAPSGVTLNLTGLTSGTQTLSIAQDNSAATSAINTFVTNYNALLTSMNSLTQYTPVATGVAQSTSNGALLGDSTLRNIQTQLASAITSSQGSSAYPSLASIGVTTDPDTGLLTVDSTKLSTALSTNSAAVSQMIVGDGKTTGVATLVNNLNTSFLSSTGTLTTATTGINNTLKDLTTQYNDTNTSIQDVIARYKTQFTALDVTIQQLNSTSSYLTQQFDSSSSSSTGS
ncbi:MAG: flagellar filament capping protein FliD [Rouxiella aceris]|uniref:flagellar filament capping protein FliD n=1 Tax=Rouxiella aceris TaxID=2703884 RepID=UPI00284D734B|nr:flagellar filament capping protein FliD [Rouxiella aceris]MDR3434438.1 flagellar filament capping protein FliD [Rouxiella aceris]